MKHGYKLIYIKMLYNSELFKLYEEDIDEKDEVKQLVMGLQGKTVFLHNHLPRLTTLISEEPELITDGIVEFGNELQELATNIDGFLNKLEELSNE